jgi:hypothetical protein
MQSEADGSTPAAPAGATGGVSDAPVPTAPVRRRLRLRREAWGFAIGSLCFLVGAVPFYAEWAGAVTVGVTFFVGSLFFTAAGFIQLSLSGRRPPRHGTSTADRYDWWAAAIQFAGTLFFNLSTGDVLRSDLSTHQEDRLVWAPDALGSACFLVSGVLAYRVSTSSRTMAGINLVGCVLFGIAAVASYIVPDTGSILDLAAANWTTALGALCFLVGAVMLARHHRGVTP